MKRPAMLRHLLPALLVLVTLFISCKKTDDGQGGSQTGIEGSWIASDYIADPGNGDLTWHPVTGDVEVISFDNTGKGRIFTNGVEASGYYQVTSDSSMEMVGGTLASRFFYSQAGDTLRISGSCVETCVTRYLRARQD